MVGDRFARDGGAVDVGIATLLLPTVSGRLGGLDGVLALIDSASAQSNKPSAQMVWVPLNTESETLVKRG